MTGNPRRDRRSSAGPRRVWRALGGALVVLGTMLTFGTMLVTAPAAHGAPIAPTSPSGQAPVTVTVRSVSPSVTRPGDTLTVVATLHNTTAAPIERIVTALSVHKFAFVSRSALDAWEQRPVDQSLGTVVATDATPDPLAPGQRRTVTLTVPADSIGLLSSPEGWGPRGIAVSAASGGARLGATRSFMLWLPSSPTGFTRLSIVAPLTEPPGTPAPFGTAGRLSEVLAATEPHRAIAWAIDAAVLNRAANDGAAGTQWLARVRNGVASHDVYALPYADADVAALADADRPDLYLTAVATGQQRLQDALSTGELERLSWPLATTPDRATIGLAGASAPALVLLDSASLSLPEVLTYTPTGRSQISTPDGDVGLALSDDVLTGQLADAGARTPAVAAQRVLAETAMITRERPALTRHVLAALPRNWAPSAATAAQLSALDEAPWLDLTPFAALVGTQPVSPRPSSLSSSGTMPGALSADDADRIGTAIAHLDAFASVPTDSQTALGSLPTDLLALTSTAWRADPAGRSAAIDATVAKVSALTGSVTVVHSSAVNLIADSGEIPASVHNGLDQPIRVLVRLQPHNARLVANTTLPLEIPAHETASVRVPVHAVANGDVDVDVVVLSPSGATLTSGDRFTVRVRADWENLATLAIAALLVIGLVVGIVRTVRRGRSATRLSADEARAEIEESPGVAEEMELLEQREGRAESDDG